MSSRGPDAAVAHELRVGGHLDQRWSAWLDGFALTLEVDGTSALRGVVRDQSELHGLLAKVRDLGTTLSSVTSLTATAHTPTERGHTHHRVQKSQVRRSQCSPIGVRASASYNRAEEVAS